ncbi:MAG: TIGR02556 family CRISPR-associated protein [Bacillota bacterium]
MLRAVSRLPGLLGGGTDGDDADKFTMGVGPTYIHEIGIVFERRGEELRFLKTELREASRSRSYLFREKKGNVKVPWSPTLRSSGKGASPLVQKLINYCAELNEDLFPALHRELVQHREEVEDQVARMLAVVGQKKAENAFITILLQEEGQEYYPGDIEAMRKLFLQRVRRQDHHEPGTLPQGTCSVCGDRNELGRKVSDVFRFATFDKPGFAYAMDSELSWVNLPVCDGCFGALAAGRVTLDELFRFSFFGYSAWIIPKTVSDSSKALRYFTAQLKKKVADFSVTMREKEQAKSYLNLEMDTLELFRNEQNWIQFDFLYFRENNSEVKIELYVEDVLPTYLSDLLNTKKSVEKRLQRYGFAVQSREYVPGVSFERLYRAFGRGRKKHFLDYVRSILGGSSISKMPFLQSVLDQVSSSLREGYPIREKVLDALAMLEFMGELGILREIKGGIGSMGEGEGKVEAFFTAHEKFFSSEEEKAVFLLGILTERLMYHQRKERKSQPFAKKLRGLKMQERDFQQLLPEICLKYQQYRRQPPGELTSAASKHLVAAGKGWKTRAEDLNFVFALGLSLSFDEAFFNPKEEPSLNEEVVADAQFS